jgi:hypothetical protein
MGHQAYPTRIEQRITIIKDFSLAGAAGTSFTVTRNFHCTLKHSDV